MFFVGWSLLLALVFVAGVCWLASATTRVEAVAQVTPVTATQLGERFAGLAGNGLPLVASQSRHRHAWRIELRLGEEDRTHHVLIDLDDGPDRTEFGGTVCLAIAADGETVSRRSRIVGGREWVRLGAVEMGLDCLRRYLQDLPVHERIDFEKV